MKTEQTPPIVSRMLIRLTPAIDDWATLQFQDPKLSEINISKIKNINFNHIGQKELKYLLYMHYRLAEYFTQKFEQDMDINVSLYSVEAVQLAYEDFIAAHQEKIIQADLPIGNLGKAELLLDWNLADMLITRMAGGHSQNSVVDQFSELELSMLKIQIEEMIPPFTNIWKKIFSLENVSMSITSGDYRVDKRIALRDSYVGFNFLIYFGESELLKLTIAYPGQVLKQLLKMKDKLPDPIQKRIVLNNQILEKIKIPMKMILGRTILPMKDLKTIQKGDIIVLDNKITDPVEIQLLGKIKFFAQPGTMKNHLAVHLIFSEAFNLSKQKTTEIRSPIKSVKTEPMEAPKLTEEKIEEKPEDQPTEELEDFEENFDEVEETEETAENQEEEIIELKEDEEDIEPEEEPKEDQEEIEDDDDDEEDEDEDEDEEIEDEEDSKELEKAESEEDELPEDKIEEPEEESDQEDDDEDEFELDDDLEEPEEEPEKLESPKVPSKESSEDESDDFSWDDIDELKS